METFKFIGAVCGIASMSVILIIGAVIALCVYSVDSAYPPHEEDEM